MRALMGEKAQKIMKDPNGRQQLRDFLASGKKEIEITLSSGEKMTVSSERPERAKGKAA